MEPMVLRSAYLDPDIDRQIREVATARGREKADVFRGCLAAGMKIARAHPEMFAAIAVPDDVTLVFRSVYLRAKVDDRLRLEAFDSQISKNSLVRRYVRLGLNRVLENF